MTDSTDPKTIVREFYEGYNHSDLSIVFDRHVADDVIVHALGDEFDRARWLEIDSSLKVAFSDFSMTILDQVAEDDRVATRWSIRGTQKADFFGVPSTGRTETLTGTAVDRVRNGRLAEHWLEIDITGFLKRLAGEGQ